MPALAEPELNELFASLGQFSEPAFGGAIADARDPHKAAQFTQRLRKALASPGKDGFLEAALCVILGEAKVEIAVPILLDAVEAHPDALVAEPALYALHRMSTPALQGPLAELEQKRQGKGTVDWRQEWPVLCEQWAKQYRQRPRPSVVAEEPAGAVVAGSRDDEMITSTMRPEPTDPIRRAEPKVGRNELCPCGSGKKYKKCCGR